MRRVAISAIEIDGNNRILVYPENSSPDEYEFVWRDASEVRWDSANRCLVSGTPRKLSHTEWFNIVIAAIRREYGTELYVTARTEWTTVPDNTRNAILAKYLQKAITD